MGILLSLIFVLELIFFILAMHYMTKFFSVISIPGLAFLFLFINHGYYIPVILLKGQIFGPLDLNDDLKLKLFLSLSLMYVFFITGIALVKFLFRFRIGEIVAYAKKPILRKKNIYPALFLFLLLTILFFYSVSQEMNLLERFATYFSNFGQSETIKQLRANSGIALSQSGIVGALWGWSLYVFFPLITLTILGVFFTEKKLIFGILGFLAAAMTSAALFSGLHRANILVFWIMIVFSVWIFKGELIYKKTKLLMLSSIIILCGALLYLFTYNVSLTEAVYFVFNRFTEVTNFAWILHLKYFPDYYDFLWGRDIGLLSSVMGWDYVSSPQLIANTFGAKDANFNALFISGLWVNFGYFGIIIGSFLVGAYLQWLQIWIIRSPRTLTRMALFGYLSIEVFYLANISVFPVLFSFGLATAPLFILVIEMSGSFFPMTFARKKQNINQKIAL